MADEQKVQDAAATKLSEAKQRMLIFYSGIVSVYYFLGIIMYMFIVETWNFTDTLYFITVTLTTAGFGVLVPTNDLSRAFTTLFICVGMVLLAVVVTDVLRTWSQERERVMNQIRTRAALGKGIRRVAKSFSGSFSDNPNSAYKVWKKHPVTRNLLLLIMFVLLFAAIFVSVEDSINYGNCIYFAVVASTTVGYGDVHPNTFAAKWAIILLLPPSVYLVSSTLSDIASFILDNNPQSNDGGENVLLTDSHVLDQQKDLSAKGLLEWSKSNHRNVNGGISEGDYLQFILSQSQLIDEDVIKKLRDKFAGMDESRSGVINKTELEHLAEESPLRSFGSSDDRLSVDSLTGSDSLNMLTINYEVQPVGDASDV